MAKPKIRNLPDLSHLARPGAEVALRVTPKAARTSLTTDGTAIHITVTTAPENGKATTSARAVLAAAMGVAPSRLTLKRGATSRLKLFVYNG